MKYVSNQYFSPVLFMAILVVAHALDIQLKATLAALDADLEDLEESVRSEPHPQHFVDTPSPFPRLVNAG